MKTLFTFLILCGAGISLATGYFDTHRRVTSRTIEGTNVIYHWRQGRETGVITQRIKRVTGKLSPVRYSKLKLITAAKAAGRWDALKTAIQAMGVEDEWHACQFIASDYPAYIAATNAVVTQGIATETEVKAFMRQAED